MFNVCPPFLPAQQMNQTLRILDEAFLPEVSLHAKPHCDLASDCDGRGRTLGPRRLPVRVSPLG